MRLIILQSKATNTELRIYILIFSFTISKLWIVKEESLSNFNIMTFKFNHNKLHQL